MRIALSTPRGNVGRHLTRDLIRSGIRPLLLSHAPRTPDSLAPYVDSVTVDLRDPDAWLRALDTVDALYLVVPPDTADDPIRHYETVGAAAARAIGAHGVRQVVLQSSVGAELRNGAGEIDGLARVEQALDELAVGSGTRVTHLRCGFFFTNLLFQLDALRAGEVSVILPVDHRMPWVAPRDIAAVAASLLVQQGPDGRHVQAVHGPRDLSWAEAAAEVSEATGRPLRVIQIPDDDMRAALSSAGLSPAQVEGMVGMSVGLREGFEPEQPRDAISTTETTLGAWAFDVLRPLLSS